MKSPKSCKANVPFSGRCTVSSVACKDGSVMTTNGKLLCFTVLQRVATSISSNLLWNLGRYMSYLACSSDSDEGFCGHVDTTCSPLNTCRTCSSFKENGGKYRALDVFPNATVAEYGKIDEYKGDADHVMKIKKEIYTRGPVSATIQADSLENFMGGSVFGDEYASRHTNHVVEIVGWEKEGDVEARIIRNSWGVYWGEGGFFRVKTGSNILGVEQKVAWATPGTFTVDSYPCSEDGKTCGSEVKKVLDRNKVTYAGQKYVDPSTYLVKEV